MNKVPCEEVDIGETTTYHFTLNETSHFPFLAQDDLEILGVVIKKLGKMTKKEIVEFMHKEQAYTETAFTAIIEFKHAKYLQI